MESVKNELQINAAFNIPCFLEYYRQGKKDTDQIFCVHAYNQVVKTDIKIR